jgi:hypothetical protein
MPDDAPVFVVGSMRSGSTLLRLILDSHPRLAIPPETGFMGAVAATKRIPGWAHGEGWYRRIDWTEAELDERLGAFFGEMFARYAAARGKARWGDKTPFHTAHIASMAAIFPGSRFVGLVRHPGAVAASLRAKFHYTFEEALDYWQATNLDLVEGAAELGARLTLLRYEDLLSDGEAVLREVMAAVGEEFSPSLLQHHVVQHQQGAARVVEGSTRPREPIDARRADRWAGSLAPGERAALERVGPLAAFFGYGSSDAERAPLEASAGRRWTLDGGDIATRRAQWRDRVDFDSRPPTPVLEGDPEELARRLVRAEAVLARTRSRRALRLADALRGLQRRRSLDDVRAVWRVLRERR